MLFTCSACRQALEDNAFYKNAGRSTGVSAYCKPCSKKASAKWNRENKSRHLLNVAKHAATDKYKETGAAWRKANRQTLTEKMRIWRNENRDKVNANAKKSRLKNKERILRTNRERQIFKKTVRPLWADKNAIARIYREARRLTKETGIPHDVDHIIPIKGKRVTGLHVETNLQILPANENRRKSNKFNEAQL